MHKNKRNSPTFPIICNDTGETFTNYKEYLSSNHWSDVKNRYYASKLPKKCGRCLQKKPCDLHHKTYKRIGEERLTDLILLCRECHYESHQLLYNNKRSHKNLWNIHKLSKKKRLEKCSTNCGLC